MTIINNGTTEITLKACAASYRALKLRLECDNLKMAFFDAYENIDIDFLIYCIEAFGGVDRASAEAFVDGLLDEGKVQEAFAEMAEFINGMGFFGVLALREGENVIDYFRNPVNKVDTNKTIASTMSETLNSEVSRVVRERIAEENRRGG